VFAFSYFVDSMADNQDSIKFQCSFCGNVYKFFGQLARHITIYHESVPQFSVTCVVRGCKNSYRSVESLRKHTQRHHRDLLSVSGYDTPLATSCESSHVGCNSEDVFDEDDTDHNDNTGANYSDNSDDHISCSNITDMINSFHRQFTLLMLRLKEIHILSAVAQSDISNSIISMMAVCLANFRDLICQEMLRCGFMPNGDMWSDILSVDKLLEAAARDCSSDRMLTNYLKRTDMMVAPSEYVIPPHVNNDTFHYIPMLNVLKKFLSHRDVDQHLQDQLFCVGKNKLDVLESFCDGKIHATDSFFADNPDALQIHLYLDELELCNPIGAKRGKHKITAVYYLVGNVHQKFRSQQRFIHLALLVKHKHVKEYGYANVLQPLVYDLEILQADGISIIVNGSSKLVKGKLISISADNLSAHMLAGFQHHFHAGRICRFCMMDHPHMASCFSESSVVLRTPDAHLYHLDAVAENPVNSTVYGVRHVCPFATLPGFDVLTAFPPDIMHDMLEGVVPLTLRLVLKSLISRDLFSISDINSALAMVKLTHPENKPCPLSELVLKPGGHISGTAVQKLEWCLLLPRLVGKYVSQDDEAWRVYLYLREVCDLILAPAIVTDNIALLRDLIAAFLSTFVEVFGAEFFIPKMHYMVHYPRFIQLLGPMRNFWCLRFESKHQYFKKVASGTKCFKNITQTLAKRHQMRQSWEFSGTDILAQDDRALSKTSAAKFSKLPVTLQSSVVDALHVDIEDDENVSCAKHITIDSVNYKVSCVYVVGTVEEEVVPQFLYVNHICCVREVWLLCGYLLIPQRFDRHLHAYAVVEEMCSVSCHPGQIIDHTPHDFFEVDNQIYVSMRYCVVPR